MIAIRDKSVISDDVEALRKIGKSKEEIVRLIGSNSQIRISGAENYASPGGAPASGRASI